MADTYLRMTYVTELTDKDMKIISLGLTGRLKRAEDIKAAKELHMRLLKAQSIRLNEQQAMIAGAIRKAVEEDEAERQWYADKEVVVNVVTDPKVSNRGD